MKDGIRNIGFAKMAATDALKMGMTKVLYKIVELTTVRARVDVVVVLNHYSLVFVVRNG